MCRVRVGDAVFTLAITHRPGIEALAWVVVLLDCSILVEFQVGLAGLEPARLLITRCLPNLEAPFNWSYICFVTKCDQWYFASRQKRLSLLDDLQVFATSYKKRHL